MQGFYVIFMLNLLRLFFFDYGLTQVVENKQHTTVAFTDLLAVMLPNTYPLSEII